MYQVEKLEEEEAKRKERTEKREEDEVEMNVWSVGGGRSTQALLLTLEKHPRKS